MSYECFEVDVNERIAHIKMSRPEKRNSMNPTFWDELPAIVRDIDHNVKARVIVLSSTGPHFTGGLDIQAFFAAAMQDAFNAFFQWYYDTALVFIRLTPGVAARCVTLAVPLGVLAGLVASWTLLRRDIVALLRR